MRPNPGMIRAGVANPLVQNYKDDSLYRLTEAEETAGAEPKWIQQFQYDRFGNRIAFSQTLNKTSGAVQTTVTPSIDQATNRFVTANVLIDRSTSRGATAYFSRGA